LCGSLSASHGPPWERTYVRVALSRDARQEDWKCCGAVSGMIMDVG
jgi:hypothetical protein